MCVCLLLSLFFFFKQKTAYELRISDWSSDVCSSDLTAPGLKPCSAIAIRHASTTAVCAGVGHFPRIRKKMNSVNPTLPIRFSHRSSSRTRNEVSSNVQIFELGALLLVLVPYFCWDNYVPGCAADRKEVGWGRSV